jgi:hypothetical protein
MTPMNRIAALCSLGLTACGGLTPLGSFTDTEIGNYDTGIIDLGTDDLDSDVDDGTDPVVAEGSAPQLLNISAADLGSQISVAFTATDADNNLNGGPFELTVNGATTAYDIPDSLSTWDGASGAGTIRFPTPSVGSGSGCGAGTSTLSIRGLVEDNAGDRSGPQSTTLALSGGTGGGVPTVEVGDTVEDVYDVGVLTIPCVVSGDMYLTGGGSGYGDYDTIAFSVASSGSGVDLSWAGTADYDVIYFFDSGGFLLMQLLGDPLLSLGSGLNSGSLPESLNWPLTVDETYYAVIGGWEGPTGAYSLTVR